jgi:hypothetical protein
MGKKSGCRDCKRCTESALGSLFRLTGHVATVGTVYVSAKAVQTVMKNCPQCSHPLSWHERDEKGHFKD